ncbi:MAG: acylphosphatase [Acidobacteriota bacterium]
MTARRYIVEGRVQGVGFRYFVVREAQALGLSGWVRNMADGRVEVLAAGDDSALEVLAGRLWEGPRSARVSAMGVSDGDAPGWTDFRILPTPW